MSRNALLCTADERIGKAAAEAGFRATRAASAGEALPKVRHDDWDLIVVDDTTDFDTTDYLHHLPGARRRDLFVVRVGDRFTTGDRFEAWCESADLVVHGDDVENLGLLVEDWEQDKAGFYRRFHEILHEAGTRLGAHA